MSNKKEVKINNKVDKKIQILEEKHLKEFDNFSKLLNSTVNNKVKKK